MYFNKTNENDNGETEVKHSVNLVVATEESETTMAKLFEHAEGLKEITDVERLSTKAIEANEVNDVSIEMLNTKLGEGMHKLGFVDGTKHAMSIQEDSDTNYQQAITIQEDAASVIAKAWESFKKMMATAANAAIKVVATIGSYLKGIDGRRKETIKKLNKLKGVKYDAVSLDDKDYRRIKRGFAAHMLVAKTDGELELAKITDVQEDLLKGAEKTVNEIKDMIDGKNSSIGSDGIDASKFSELSQESEITKFNSKNANGVAIVTTISGRSANLILTSETELRYAKVTLDENYIKTLSKVDRDDKQTVDGVVKFLEASGKMKIKTNERQIKEMNKVVKDFDGKMKDFKSDDKSVDEMKEALAQRKVIQRTIPIVTKMVRDITLSNYAYQEQAVILGEWFLEEYKANKEKEEKEEK